MRHDRSKHFTCGKLGNASRHAFDRSKHFSGGKLLLGETAFHKEIYLEPF